MADLFSVSAPLMIRGPEGDGKVMAEHFPHEEGMVYFDLYWHLGQPDETIHVLKGPIKGEGPWKIGDYVVNVLGCHGTDADLAMAHDNWCQYLAGAAEGYPPEPLRYAIARRYGALSRDSLA